MGLSSSLHSWSRGPSSDCTDCTCTDCTCTCTTTVCSCTSPTTACAYRVQVQCEAQTTACTAFCTTSTTACTAVGEVVSVVEGLPVINIIPSLSPKLHLATQVQQSSKIALKKIVDFTNSSFLPFFKSNGKNCTGQQC